MNLNIEDRHIALFASVISTQNEETYPHGVLKKAKSYLKWLENNTPEKRHILKAVDPSEDK